MAALRPWPSNPVALVSSTSSARLLSSRPILSLGRRDALSLKIRAGNKARLRLVFRSQKGGADQPCEPDPKDDDDAMTMSSQMFVSSKKLREALEKFGKEYEAKLCGINQNNASISFKKLMFHDEERRIAEYTWEMVSSNSSNLCAEDMLVATKVCIVAENALHLASRVMNGAYSRLDKPSEISLHTIKQTVRMHASIFLKTAEESFLRKVDEKDILLFLGALGGLGAIGHILVEDALTGLEDGPLKNNFECDLETTYQGFKKKMNYLEQKFVMSSSINECDETKHQTLDDAIAYAVACINQTLHLRWSVLDQVRAATRAKDDGCEK